MTGPELNLLFQRDLTTLKKEVESYTDDRTIWIKNGQIPNSGGHLCWHICGNLQHFIGHILGNSPYIRDRDSEFNGASISREKLLEIIDETKIALSKTLPPLTPANLAVMYPLPYQNESITTGKFLLHLYGHMSYHLGQLNYHRRGAIGLPD